MFEFKLEDLKRARDIVSQLELPAQFGMDEDLEVPILYDQLENILDEDFHVVCGISKAVIIIDSLPFVIKIPFTGRWVREYSSWEDNEGWTEFTPFEEANKQVSDDYCYDELCNIIGAQENGFGLFVPSMMWLTTINCSERTYDIYVQEKVTPAIENKQPINPSRNSMDIAADCGYSVDVRWAAYAIDMYGADYFDSFMEWIKANCSDVLNDFHDANFGYDMGGHPVILDVSGFRD
jgi:hypothetical protein